VTDVASWSREDDQLAIGTRFALEGVSIAALMRQTGGPVRLDSFADAPGPIAQERDHARPLALSSAARSMPVTGPGCRSRLPQVGTSLAHATQRGCRVTVSVLQAVRAARG
jgi:hypothetical protein